MFRKRQLQINWTDSRNDPSNYVNIYDDAPSSIGSLPSCSNFNLKILVQ